MADPVTTFAALSSFAAAAAPYVTVGATILGTAAEFSANRQQAETQQQVADFNARELELRADNNAQIAGRKAAEERRQKRLAQSRATAVGAAYGGGVDYSEIANIEEVGELNALTHLWEGSQAQQSDYFQASVTRYEGNQYKTASRTKAIGTIAGGATTLFEQLNR